MHKTLLASVILTAAALLYGGCRPDAHTRSGQASGGAVQDYTGEAYRWADSLISRMSLGQRVGQLFIPAVYAVAEEANMTKITEYATEDCVGGIILLRGNSRGARAIADTLRRLSPLAAPWIAIDAETGLAMRLSDAPAIPCAATLGASADEQRMYAYGESLAAESRSRGINMVLGPVLDVEADKKGYIGKRSFGSDPGRVGELGTAFARGLEDGGVMSVAKHFPGHGCAGEDSHKGLAVIAIPLSDLHRSALPPFRGYIAAGLSAVMVGHLAVTAIDPKMRSAALSEAVITDLLRGDLGFKGLVMTDALNMHGADNGTDTATDPSVAALLAGADIILSPTDTRAGIDAVKKAIADGTLTEATINGRLRRILFYKYRFTR